ncbi:MAG: DNA methyltransferase [Candidatus Dojkabacteria bacterium]|nr:MAG: DNA methyltransferase [Candidatus Dojkabacteria bacterium]
MKYFFIPGRLRDLSAVEISQQAKVILDKYSLDNKGRNFFVLESDQPEQVAMLFNRLGGFIKYGEVYELDADLSSIFPINLEKVNYGVSGYSNSSAKDLHDKVMKISRSVDKYLKDSGIKSRYIRGDRGELSSAQILGNNLIEKGADLSLLQDFKGELSLGKTLAVQDIAGFSMRDYERPAFDKKMGMLPPKLARIMVNLASVKPGATIWDPFCGVGTIPLEALLLGYNVLGSDLDEEMVNSTEENIAWLSKNYDLGDQKYALFQYDVTDYHKGIRKKLRNTEIHAVVFEPYMGPPQRKVMAPGKANELLNEVQKLYEGLFLMLEHIDKHELTVVAVLPSYKTHKGWMTLRYSSLFSKKWEIINNKVREKDLHWERTNSIIRRNLLILKMKS